jgi:hypothetical protein
MTSREGVHLGLEPLDALEVQHAARIGELSRDHG